MASPPTGHEFVNDIGLALGVRHPIVAELDRQLHLHRLVAGTSSGISLEDVTQAQVVLPLFAFVIDDV